MTHTTPFARPFLKWAGGKTGLLSEILPRLPKKIKTYYEPFIGGGAVFFALAAEKRFKKAVIGDSNPELRDAYIAVAHYPNALILRLQEHAARHNEQYYYDVRGAESDGLSTLGARFIYLNKTCFNGLYRVNRKGEFNVPFGRYTNPKICDENNLVAVNRVLLGSKCLSVGCDFERTVSKASRGDAVYFDPPYVPLSATSNFAAYTKEGFGPLEQERLRDVAAKLRRKGVFVLLSNSDTPFVRKLYKGFKIEEVQARRAINSKGAKRGKVGELLISGGQK